MRQSKLLHRCSTCNFHRLSFFQAVRLPSFVVRQDVTLRLLVHYLNVVLSEVDDIYPVTGRVRYFKFYG